MSFSAPPSLPYPDGVFFDFDGTLVDSRALLECAHNHVRDVYGMPHFSQADFDRMLSSTTREIYARLYGQDAETAKKVLFAYINDHQGAHLKPIEGAQDTLDFFLREGIVLGIVSNKDQTSLDSAIDHLGWRRYFRAVVGAGAAANGKPFPDPLFLAMAQAGVPRGRVDHIWMVGDHEADIQCADAAGAVSILVQFGRDCADTLQVCTPGLVISEIGDLPLALSLPVL